MARVVAHDALMLTGHTPADGLPAFGMTFGYDDELFYAVQSLGHHLGTAYDREGPARNPLSIHGIGSELRMPLRDRRGAWGTLSLLRSEGGRPYDTRELSRAGRLAPALTAFLREYVTAGPLMPSAPMAPAGVVIVRADQRIRALTPQARSWVEQMPRNRRSPRRIHEANLLALAAQARDHARDPRLAPAVVRAPAASYGRWLISHAQPLGDGTEDIVITIQAATGRLLVPAFSRWYGLTVREGQVLEQLCTDAAPKHIARRLELSAHTVNDHLKAIYRKTRASGREELTAALTA
jgi:DNA-binding CsgD family transcriptional regulator